MISLERWWGSQRNQLFLFLLGVLNWTELRKTDFDVREAGILAHHEIFQVLLIGMTLRLIMLNRRNLIRWWLSFFYSYMRSLLLHSVWPLHLVLKIIVVYLFLREYLCQLVFEHLGIVVMAVSILSLELMQWILYSSLVELNHSSWYVSVEGKGCILKRILFCKLYKWIFNSWFFNRGKHLIQRILTI